MIRTNGLYHIHLVVRDLPRALRFYRDVFGMVEEFRAGPHMVFLSTPGTSDMITLNQDPDAVARGRRQRRHRTLRLPPDRCDAAGRGGP